MTETADTGKELTKDLKSDDVLFGRGTGTNEYIGNRRFRAIVEDLKEIYASVDDLDQKRRIARKVYDQIHAAGGRFLKLADNAKDVESAIEDGEWQETDQKAALEKIKRALRERTEDRGTSMPVTGPQPSPVSSSSHASIPRSSDGLAHEAMMVPSMSFSSVLPPALVASAPSLDARLRLFERSHQFSEYGHAASASRIHTQPAHGQLHGNLREDMARFEVAMAQSCNIGTNVAAAFDRRDLSLAQDLAARPMADDDLSEFLMSAISVANRPVLTKQQVDAEQANLTDDEKAAALSDLFGKCYSADARQSKRPRRLFDDDSIAFLVKQMRLEIDRIPNHRKVALNEARDRCRAEEFNDARLELFLRCEGMNVKLAAQRFVNYWESRRDVFGSDKFTMRMALSEALRDDLPALQTGYYSLLPHVDSSGRALVFCDPARHTSEGYTTESLLRAVWYVVEVASRRTQDIGSGVVRIMWGRNVTMFDYDRKVVDRLIMFDDCVWPVRFSAVHLCCPTSLVARVIVPVVVALKNKSSRCRTLLHDVPEREIVQVLAEYGITRDMLPAEMGGSVEDDASEWITRRRAAELEEIL